jgi:hypothetical protein
MGVKIPDAGLINSLATMLELQFPGSPPYNGASFGIRLFINELGPIFHSYDKAYFLEASFPGYLPQSTTYANVPYMDTPGGFATVDLVNVQFINADTDPHIICGWMLDGISNNPIENTWYAAAASFPAPFYLLPFQVLNLALRCTLGSKY